MQTVYPELLCSKGQAFLNLYTGLLRKLRCCQVRRPEAEKELALISKEVSQLGRELNKTVNLINTAYNELDKSLTKLEAHQILYYRSLNDKLSIIKASLERIVEELTILDDKGINYYKTYKRILTNREEIERQLQELDVCLLSLIRSDKIASPQFLEGKRLKKALKNRLELTQKFEQDLKDFTPQLSSTPELLKIYLHSIIRKTENLYRLCSDVFRNYRRGIVTQQILN